MNITIIGAGLAGLSTGLHLQSQGYRVQILEKNSRIGGRANRIEEGGFKFDTGPTLIFMPSLLEETFRTVGRNLSDYLRLKRIEPAYQIIYSDGKRFEMTSDLDRLKTQIADFEPGREKMFGRYFKDVEDKLVYSEAAFIRRNFNSLLEMVNPTTARSFLKIKPWGSAYDHVNRYFRNPYLAAAFSFQSLYLGQSPFKTPSLYNMLAYLEFAYGAWYPMGGMYELPKALAKVFEESGGVIRTGTEVEKIHIENGRARGVVLKGGELDLADLVVSNCDLPTSYRLLVDAESRPSFPDSKINNWHYSSSSCLYYLGLKRRIRGLSHHNVLLDKNLKIPCDEIFGRGELPSEPQLYVCCPTKTDPSLAPEGKEIIYALAITPNLKSKIDWEARLPKFRLQVIERLKKAGADLEESDIEVEKFFGPRQFESHYGMQYGTAFGLAPDFFQSAAFRPGIRSRDVRGLYHVGSSTHPGGGVPMTVLCGRIASDQIRKDVGAPTAAGVAG
ncbi:MAG: phytoene desaturase [Candidatus Omnitrophica bacterium]|nr:phytoene desaturase [Candidatus Omnitrophota bacterium]